MKFSSLKIKDVTPLLDIAIFVILILGFHFFFRWWAYGENIYWPVETLVMPVYDFLSNLLFQNSVWVLQHFTNYDFTTDDTVRKIFVLNGYVGVNHGCSGFKQFLQWIVLMVFFPGSWKHKLWFIPLGLFVIHAVNIMRITSLSAYLCYNPSQANWDFAHDYILRPFFYVVMFLMWIIWNEKIRNNK